MMSKAVLMVMLALAACAFRTSSFAQDSTAKTMLVTANVIEESQFIVKLFKGSVDSSGNANFDWSVDLPGLDFGELGPADPADPRSALASSSVFMAYCVCVNNSGNRYYVKYEGAPLSLADGSASLSSDAWVVSAGAQTGDAGGFNTFNTQGLMTGKISGATASQIVYSSTADGRTDVFRVYFSIVGNTNLAVRGASSSLIPPSQKPGMYSGTVRLTMYN